MTLRAILLCVLFFCFGLSAFALQATTTRTLYYTKSSKDSNQYAANILLSWRVQNSTLHFTKDGSNHFASKFVCSIRISNAEGIFKEESFKIVTPAQETPADAFLQLIADQYDYALPPGHYTVQLGLYEPDHKDQAFDYVDTFTIHTPQVAQAFLSDIQLLDTFFVSNAKSIYARNGYINLSLNSNYLDEKKESLSYYYEVYEAKRTKQNTNPVKVNSYLSWKPFATPVPGFELQDSIYSNKAFQAIHANFPLQTLSSGNYYLNVVLSDKYGMVIDKKSIFIQRYNTRPRPAPKPKELPDSVQQNDVSDTHVLDLTNTFVGKYTPAQVRAILKMMLLVCDETEGNSIQGFLRKPDELYGKYFIYNFWEKRDKQNPDRAWKAYAERIKEINKLFGNGRVGGYETDRGRIYIQYGKPNDRIIVNNEAGALPYEIWQYYSTEKQQREGVFLFYKPGRYVTEYELLHSTLVGERRNATWRSLLYSNTVANDGFSNSNSQAEQYIGNK